MKDIPRQELASRISAELSRNNQVLWWDSQLGEYRIVEPLKGERIMNLEEYARAKGLLGVDERMAT